MHLWLSREYFVITTVMILQCGIINESDELMENNASYINSTVCIDTLFATKHAHVCDEL